MKRATYDLEDRLIRFGAAACRLCATLPDNPLGRLVSLQLIRCSTSPFANHGEVQAAESRRDFIHKLQICLKELRESRAWLKFIVAMGLASDDAAVPSLIEESRELISIFRASVSTARRNGSEEMSNGEYRTSNID